MKSELLLKDKFLPLEDVKGKHVRLFLNAGDAIRRYLVADYSVRQVLLKPTKFFIILYWRSVRRTSPSPDLRQNYTVYFP